MIRVTFILSTFLVLLSTSMGEDAKAKAIESSVDTDGDGYLDAFEIEMGTDPSDPDDRIYQGGWPYNPNKESMNSTELPISCPGQIGCECVSSDECSNDNCTKAVRGDFYCFPKIGDPFPRLMSLDQFGEEVDLYDFANQGKPILLEMGTAWCKPCNELAAWLAYDDDSIKSAVWWKPEYDSVKEKIKRGEILFITILYENVLHADATFDTVRDWYEKYPDDKVPVMSDDYKELHYWLKPNGLPCINLLDENMRMMTYTGRGLTQAFDVVSRLGSKADKTK